MTLSTKTDYPVDNVYEFRVRGELGTEWSEWFDGFTIAASGNETLLSGPVRDQAAMYGLIAKFRNLGLTLISVNCEEAKVAAGASLPAPRAGCGCSR